VAIWLGPESDDSNLAMDLLQKITRFSGSPANDMMIKNIIKSPEWIPYFRALVELFERD
jgi:hypothetical protein